MWNSENEYRIIGLHYVFFGCLVSILFWIDPMNQALWSGFFMFYSIFNFINAIAIFFCVIILVVVVGSLFLVFFGLVLGDRGGEGIANASRVLLFFVTLCYSVLSITRFLLLYGVA